MSFNSLPLLNNQYGSFNYLLNGNFDRLSTFAAQVVGAQNWNAYKDAAAVTPVDGTGGSPTIINNAVVSSGVLRGIRSWQITKTGNAQGEGYSSDFTIDTPDEGISLAISFDYSAGSAYTSGDLAVYIYDITNSQLITPASVAIPSSSGSFLTTFAASASSKSYRLIIHCAASNATTTNWSMTLDNMRVGTNAASLVTSNYWAGYNAGTRWTTSSNTYGDGTNTGGNALTTRVSSGISVTAGASNVMGITFTPASSAAIYRVSCSFCASNNGVNGNSFRLYDGTNTVCTGANFGAAVSWITLEGIYAPGTGSAITLKVQIATGGGTFTIDNENINSLSSEVISWTLMRIV